MTKGITQATAKAVAAGNSCRQEDIIATANLSRRAIAEMLHSCKVTAHNFQLDVFVLFILFIYLVIFFLLIASGLPPRGKPRGADSCPALRKGVCQWLPGSPGACSCGKLVPLIGQSVYSFCSQRDPLTLLPTHTHTQDLRVCH